MVSYVEPLGYVDPAYKTLKGKWHRGLRQCESGGLGPRLGENTSA